MISHMSPGIVILWIYIVGTHSNDFLRWSLENHVTVVNVRVFAHLSLVLTYFRRLSSALRKHDNAVDSRTRTIGNKGEM